MENNNVKEIPPIRTFIDMMESQADRFSRYLSANDWTTKSKENKEEEFSMHEDMVNISISTLKQIYSNYEPFLDFKYVKEFITKLKKPIEEFISRCDEYIENNDWSTTELISEKKEEMEFQNSKVIPSSLSFKNSLQKLNAKDKNEDYGLPTYGDKPIPYLMKSTVENLYPSIKSYIDDVQKNTANPINHTIYDVSGSTEMFINIKNPPPYDFKKNYYEQLKDTIDFFDEEYIKCRDGITIAGVYISGWLYWHLNFFKTDLPMSTVEGTPLYNPYDKTIIHNPPLRDNEWFFAYMLEKAKKENVGLAAFGSRRISKTTTEASYLSRIATIVKNSENVVLGGDVGDLKKLSKSFEIAFLNIHPAFKLPRNNNDWEKHVQFGLKDKSGERIPYSDIFIKNVNGGKGQGSQKAAGNTPQGWVCDEIGKFDIKKIYEPAIPSFESPTGWTTTPLLFGCLTAGNKVFDKFGNLINIEELKLEDGILGFNSENVIKEKINWFKPPAYKECLKITTTNNNKIECSTDHPLMVQRRTNSGYSKIAEIKKSDDLKVGDKLLVIDKIDLFGDYNCKDAYLFGLMVGDGCSINGNNILSVNDKDIENFIHNNYDCNELSNKVTETNKSGCKSISIRGINGIMKYEGLKDKTKTNKSLPKNIGIYDKKSLSEFIAGYFDADGNVNISKKGVRVVLSSVVLDLLEDLRFYLLKFGIHSSIIKEFRKGGYKPNSYIYRLYINKYIDVLRFYENIPLKIESKKEKLRHIKNIKLKSYWKPKDFKFNYNENLKKGKYFKDKEIKNMRTLTIKNIEYVGEKEVYNLNTSITNSYVSNGFISMNTGGDRQLSASAHELLTNPKANKLLSMDWDFLEEQIPESRLITWKRSTFSMFLPAQMSIKKGMTKKEVSLNSYLNKKSKELKDIMIRITDWEKSLDIIMQDRKDKENDLNALNSEKMAFPIDPLEPFLNQLENPFTCLEEALETFNNIMETGDWGLRVDISLNDDGKMVYTESDKKMAEFPFRGGNINAPAVIYEKPPKNPEFDGTYAGGLDHYKHKKADTDSVGVLYILKGMYNLNDPWANRIVFSYASRPDSMKDFNKVCYAASIGYGSQILQENADISFQQFLADRNKEELILANGEEMVRRLFNPNANQNNPFGLNPSSKNKDYIFKLVLSYCNEKIQVGTDLDGQPIEKKGVIRIPDPYLLKEIMDFKYGMNVDRITAFGHALAWLRYLDSLNIVPKTKKRKEQITEMERKRRSLRNSSNSAYSITRYNPYQ